MQGKPRVGKWKTRNRRNAAVQRFKRSEHKEASPAKQAR